MHLRILFKSAGLPILALCLLPTASALVPRTGSGSENGGQATCNIFTDDYANAPVDLPIPGGSALTCLAKYSTEDFMEMDLVYARFCPSQPNAVQNALDPLNFPSGRFIGAFLISDPSEVKFRPFGSISAAPSSSGDPRTVTLKQFTFGCTTSVQATGATPQDCTISVCPTAQDGSQPECAVFEFKAKSSDRNVSLTVADLTLEKPERFTQVKNITIGILASEVLPVTALLHIGSVTACVQ